MNARLIVGTILALLLLLMQYRLWIAPDSVPDAWTLKHKVEAQKQENRRLDTRNRSLDAEVRDLKQGHEAVEARARKELGMVKQGETFYQVVVSPSVLQPRDKQASRPEPPQR